MRLGRGWLVVVCTGYALATLRLCPDWLLAKYPNLAERLRAGTLGPAEASDASPAYLLLHVHASPGAVRWLQALAGVATLVCVHVLATRLRGKVAAAVAVPLLAIAQGWLIYSAVLEPDLFIAALHAAALVALVAGARARTSAGAGAALGLAAALRPTSLLVGLVAAMWLIVDRRRTGGVKAHIALYALAFGVAALVPAMVLHAGAGQDLRATMSAGQVFHQGHRPEDVGLRAHYPVLIKLLEANHAARPGHQPDYAHELYRRVSGLEDPVAAERYWVDRTLAFAAAEPWAFAAQLGRKWIMTLAAPSPGADIAGVAGAVQGLPVGPWLPTHLLALAGVAGLLLTVRRGREARLLALFVVSAQVVAVVFYHQQRYGVGLLPVWAALGGALAASIWEVRRAPRRLAATLALAGAPYLVLALPFVRFEHRLEARRMMVPVRSPIPALREAGDWAAAHAQFIEEQARFPDSLWPWSPRGLGLDADGRETALAAAEVARARFGDEDPVDAFLLAVLYRQAGRCDLALPLADRAADAGFHSALEETDVALDPDLLASDCLLGFLERDQARRRIERSLARWPGTRDGLARAVAAGLGEEHERRLFALHDPASAHFALARARRRWGDPRGAMADAATLAELVPEAAPLAAFERALCLLELGQDDQAIAEYARSLAIGYFVYGSGRFDEPVRELITRYPKLAPARELARRHAARQGRRG